MLRLLWLTLLLPLTGCTGLSVLNAVTPDRGYTAANNIAYASGRDRRLDIYTPQDIDRAPTVVFFHGGRWTEGSKDEYVFVGEALASRGFVTVIADFRKYPDVRFPTFVDDAASAVGWVRENISRYGGDPDRIFVMGHSSGAQMAALLSLDQRYLQRVGMKPTDLSGFIGLAGPYDFDPGKDDDLADIFGPPERYRLARAIEMANRNVPPMLLVHAEDDKVVYPSNSRNLANAIVAAGGRVETLFYDGVRCGPRIGSHACMVAVLARPFRGRVDLLNQITDFISEQSADAPSRPSGARDEPELEEAAPGRWESIWEDGGGDPVPVPVPVRPGS
jgi:acetyl esterase/lipase